MQSSKKHKRKEQAKQKPEMRETTQKPKVQKTTQEAKVPETTKTESKVTKTAPQKPEMQEIKQPEVQKAEQPETEVRETEQQQPELQEAEQPEAEVTEVEQPEAEAQEAEEQESEVTEAAQTEEVPENSSLQKKQLQNQKKKKQRLFCLILIAITLIAVVIATITGKPKTREYSVNAVVGEKLDKSFSVEHEFENCEFGIANQKGDNFQDYGLTLFVDSTGISVSGIPNKIGTAVSTAYYKDESKTVYVQLKVNIGHSEEDNYNVQKYTEVAQVGKEVLMRVDVDHGFENCTFHESYDDRDNYREFGLNFYISSEGLLLAGTPTKTGVVRASAIYESDKTNVQPCMAVIVLTVSDDGKMPQNSGEKDNGGNNQGSLSYAVELTVGENADMVLPVEHGLSDCKFEEAADAENTCADYGLTVTPSAEGIAFSGTPTKAGNAVYTAYYYTETERVTVQVKVTLTDDGMNGTESFTAVAGEPFAQMIYFTQLGIDMSKCQVKPAEEFVNSLSDFNLTADYGYESVTIEGTPTQGGTATVTMEVLEEGKESRNVSFDINITVPERITLDVNGKVGEAMESVTELNSDDYQAEPVGDWQDKLNEAGLEAICNGKQLTVKGTPTEAGKFYACFNLTLDNRMTYLIAEINVEDAEHIVLTSRTVDGKVTLYTDIPLSGNYTFTLYRNSIRSTAGAKAANGYDSHPASERSHSIGLNFKKLNRPVYYFYIVAKQGNTVLTSDYVRVVNPDVQMSSANPFTDVSKDNPNAEEILYAVDSGLLNGKTADTFQGDSGLLVCEAVKIASCMHEYYLNGEITLKNAESGAWYSTYMDYAVENGIISEKQFAGVYCEAISKADFVRLFASVLPEYEYNEINEVADGSIQGVDVQQIYANAVYTLARAGILDSSAAFSAEEGIQRGEAAVVIARMINPALRLAK